MEAENKLIYMDNAATTPVHTKVLECMLPYFTNSFGNASGLYSLSVEAKKAVTQARKILADMLDCYQDEIIFTSGGTESDNLAILGAADAARRSEKGNHIITTNIEHPAVRNTCEFLGQQGYDITCISVDRKGMVNPLEVEKAITKKTILVTVMLANNEIGTIQPIREISRITQSHKVLLHTDAVQVFGQLPCKAAELGIDLLSGSAHKFYGPKGIGFLYCKRGTKITCVQHGGRQENGRRAGTENVPLIAGLGKAAELAGQRLEEQAAAVREIRNIFMQRIMNEIPGSRVNGDIMNRLPGNLSVTFEGIEGESLLFHLDMHGICASSGSACSTGSKEMSHVLKAIGHTKEEARGTLRFTLSYSNTQEEIEYVMKHLKESIEMLRALKDL